MIAEEAELNDRLKLSVYNNYAWIRIDIVPIRVKNNTLFHLAENDGLKFGSLNELIEFVFKFKLFI